MVSSPHPPVSSTDPSITAVADPPGLSQVPSLPDRIGRFVVLGKLGEGGMGVVASAYDAELGRRVAIKILRSDQPAAQRQQRMLREARAMARLSHPNVAQIYEVGVHGAGLYIAMEFVDGLTLSAWRRERTRATWREIVEIFIAAGQGLEAAHRAGLVHRDFKPSNVLIGRDGRVRVLDFGLASVDQRTLPEVFTGDSIETAPEFDASTSDLAEPLTLTCEVLGTPAYMAPEQFLGREVDARTDQFAFCIALHEALFGRRPFSGRDYQHLARNVLRGRLEFEAQPRGVPRRVLALLRRGLQTDPHGRFASMGALLTELRGDRDRRRRGWIAGVVGPVLVFGGAYGYREHVRSDLQRARTDRLLACEAGASALHSAWSAEREAEIAAAFERTELAYASATWAMVRSRIEAYTARWTEAHAAACQATHVREEQDTVGLVLRLQCLDDALGGLQALTSELERADEKVVQKAARAMSSLPSLQRCDDLATLQADAARMHDPEDPERKAIEAELSKVHAKQAIGRGSEALELARGLEERVQRLGDPRLRARTRLAVMYNLRETGESAEAEKVGLEAYFQTEELGDDRLRLEAAVALAAIVGTDLRREAEGLQWGRQAEALLVRIGPHVENLAIKIKHNLGIVYASHGRHVEGRALIEEALHRRELLYPDDRMEIADLEIDLGSALQTAGEHQASRRHLERAVELIIAEVGSLHPSLVAAYANLVNACHELGDVEAAIDYSEKATQLARTILGPNHPWTAKILVNTASIYTDLERYDDAIALHREALQALERKFGPDHPALVIALSSQAATQGMAGRFEPSRELYQRALRIAEQHYTEGHDERVLPLQGLAHLHRKFEKYDESIAWFERAIAAHRSRHGEDDPGQAVLLLSIASAERGAGRLDAAQRHVEQALAFIAEQTEVDVAARARGRLDLAEILLDRGQRKAALAEAEAARAQLVPEDPRTAAEREAIEAFLAEHRTGRQNGPEGPPDAR